MDGDNKMNLSIHSQAGGWERGRMFEELLIEINYAVVISIFSVILLEALIKYFLYILNLNIIYNLFFIFIFFVFIFNIIFYFFQLKILKRTLVVLLLILIGTITFFTQSDILFQYLFGLYSLSVLIFSLSVPSKTYLKIINNHKLLNLFFAIVALGIIIDYFFKGNLPYKSFSFSIGGVDRIISTSYAGYIYRASGWQKNQLESSLIVFFLYYLISLNYISRIKSFILYIFSFCLLLLCFNKTIILAFILFGILRIIRMNKFFLKLFITAILIISSGLPFYLHGKVYKFDYSSASLEETILFASFYDRINNAWNESIVSTLKQNNGLFGNGIGGIGVAYNTFHNISNPIDNAPLYIFGTFGFFGLIILNLFLLKLIYSLEDKRLLIFIASMFTIFLTINVVEIKFFMLIFMLVWATNKKNNIYYKQEI